MLCFSHLEQLLSKLPQIVLLLLQHSLFTSFLSIFVQRYDAFLNFKTGVSVPDDDHIILVSSTYLSHPWGCHIFASFFYADGL